jgi:hypothetical protein
MVVRPALGLIIRAKELICAANRSAHGGGGVSGEDKMITLNA